MIAREFGDRDHSCVYHATAMTKKRIAAGERHGDLPLSEHISAIKAALGVNRR